MKPIALMTMTDPEPSTTDPAGSGDDPPPRSAAFDIVDARGLLTPAEREWLNANTDAALRELGQPGDVRVRIVDDDEMDDAHRRYSGIPGTTDVLTFDMADADELDVDLFVCADVAQRQADKRRHERKRELLLYIIHGLLHCLGHDDHDPEDARLMHKREDDILTAIGVGPIYAAGGDR